MECPKLAWNKRQPKRNTERSTKINEKCDNNYCSAVVTIFKISHKIQTGTVNWSAAVSIDTCSAVRAEVAASSSLGYWEFSAFRSFTNLNLMSRKYNIYILVYLAQFIKSTTVAGTWNAPIWLVHNCVWCTCCTDYLLKGENFERAL